MKKYIYGKKDIKLIKFLIDNTPKKIWHTYSYCVFDYDKFHILLECVFIKPKSQNKFDEAFISEISYKKNKFIPPKDMDLVCENKKIDEAYIVRTVLCFSDYISYKRTERIKNKIIYKFKKILKRTNVTDMIKGRTLGVSEEYMCHPDSDELEDFNLKYANLLDVGLLLKINNKYLGAFLPANTYGFCINKGNYFRTIKEFTEEFGEFKYIKIDV